MSKTVDMQTLLSRSDATPQKETRLFLTESEVRSYARFKHASPEEVKHIITSLHGLALVAYAAFGQSNSSKAVETSSGEWRDAAEGRKEGAQGPLLSLHPPKAA